MNSVQKCCAALAQARAVYVLSLSKIVLEKSQMFTGEFLSPVWIGSVFPIFMDSRVLSYDDHGVWQEDNIVPSYSVVVWRRCTVMMTMSGPTPIRFRGAQVRKKHLRKKGGEQGCELSE